MILKECENPSKVQKCNLCINAAFSLGVSVVVSEFYEKIVVLTGLMNALLDQKSVWPLKGC